MGDFTRNFFLDPGITIKEEPIYDDNGGITTTNPLMNSTASVPIPTRRIMEISDYRDFGIEFDNSQSPLYQDITINNSNNIIMNDTSIWGNRLIINEDALKNEALIHMDDDDIFQVDKADLIQGPTLAELNANDDNLLGDLNFDDLLLPEEGRSGSDTTTYLATTLASLTNKNLTTITSTTTSTTSTTTSTTTPFVQIHNSNHINNNNSIVTVASSCPQTTSIFYKDLDLSSSVPTNNYDFYNNSTPISTYSPNSQTSSSSSLLQTSSSPLHMNSLQQKHSTLHELLLKNSERNSLTPPATTAVTTISTTTNSPQPLQQQQQQLQSTPSTSPNIIRMHQRTHISRLSSSAPTHLGLEQLWQRREPRKHLLSTGSLAEAGSTSSLSTGGVLSPDAQDFSHDESDSDEESDNHYEDMSSENDSDDDDQHHNNIKHHNYSNTSNNTNHHQKKERYFWQYNVQAKGPKGQRLVMKCKMEDPHILNEITDPVFSPDCSLRGIKHSGKARKGDGNDLTPNARKLFNIGKELDKLGRIINDMTPVSELPFNVRPKSRKEKNKLASRACRLKKKAQHEANKIKLNGLEIEHKNLLNAIQQCRELLMLKLQETSLEKQEELTAHIENVCKVATRIKVAGYTTDYVNKILDKLKKRQPITGLEDSI